MHTSPLGLPYIGITGFHFPEQVEQILKVFLKNRPSLSERRLHIGVMMSRKTLNGEQTRFTKAFPFKGDVRKIFLGNLGLPLYNCLHYADRGEDIDLTLNLMRAIALGGENLHALQLDIAWPDPNGISKAIANSAVKPEIILQINNDALGEIGNGPQGLVERLRYYDGVIHRVLIDKSAGRGIPMNPYDIKPFIEAIKLQLPKLKIVVAGGLGPETMHLVKPLVEEFPNISWDAEGKLRKSGLNLDPVDWGLAEKYLIESLALLKS